MAASVGPSIAQGPGIAETRPPRLARKTWRAAFSVLSLIAVLLVPVVAVAAEAGPVAGNAAGTTAVQPWLQIRAGGHTAAVRALAFTPDGKRLCSAGLDKAVQVWNLTAVARDVRRTFLRERTIPWQVARGLRGSIYCLASSAGDGLLAFGGYGAMGSLGEILLVHPVEGNLVKVLQGHRQTIASLAFSADGNWLASSDVAGQTILWRKGTWQARILYEPDSKTYDAQLARLIQTQPKLRPIAIAGSQEVVVPACVGRQASGHLGWKLQRIPLEKAEGLRTLDVVHQGVVTALAASRDGTLLASADLSGKLFLWDLKADGPPAELDPKGIVLSLSFSPDGQTLAAGTAVDAVRKASQLQIWDVASRSVKRTLSLPDHVQACAISPDNKDVAYVGGAENEVFVEEIRAPERKIALCGTGRRVLKVAFARDDPPYRIALGTRVRERGFNDYAELEESFDPVRLELGAPGPVKPAEWLPVDWCGGSWSVKPQANNTLQTYRDQAPQGRIVLDPCFEGRPRSYCWIADAKGEPVAIAVGTDVQNSVYVYRLVPQGRCPILRHFRGHHDYVTSVAVSRDLRYLASASADGTLGFWSLAKLDQGAELPGRWGAALSVQGDRLVAADVHPAGPLWGKGLRSGDVVLQIRWSDGKTEHAERDPAGVLKQLAELPWGTQVAFESARRGERQPSFQSLPAWPPLATLFVSRERQWAFWTPQGYYDASINGYTMFGWQVNRGLEKLPDFYRADQFRKTLERPDVMEHLLPAGSLEGAFERARLKPPAKAQQILPDQIAATPHVEILTPRPGQLVPADTATLRARILVPVGGNLLQAQVFANGVAAIGQRLVDRRNLPAGSEWTYDWDVRLPADPKNLIQLVVGTDAPTAAHRELLIERPAGVRPGGVPRLRILALGIDRYRDPAIQRLSFAVADAESVAAALQQHSKGWYAVERCVVLRDERATPAQWQKSLEEVCRDLHQHARPDDLLVLFFAGHGIVDRQTQQYYFVGHDFSLEDLDKRQYAACISWKDFRLLAGIPCRKLVFLDTCHAGAIQTPRSQDLKTGVRELQDHVIFTFAASSSDERSAENKAWKHGAFTQAVLESLRGESPQAGTLRITLNDVVSYVQAAVRKVTNGRQNPVAAPDEILPFTSLILAERLR